MKRPQRCRVIRRRSAGHLYLTFLPSMDEGRSPASREHLQADIVTRDAHDGEEFVMTAGGQMFSGKGAREEAAKALARAVFLRRDDGELVRPIGFDFAFATACVGK